MTAIIIALDLEHEVEIHSNIGTFNVRPDLCVVTVHAIPVGVIEVKKPDIPAGVTGLSHPNALGELFHFMKHPPNLYGVAPALGIVTHMNSWRMAWIPNESGDVDRMAAECSGFETNDAESVDLVPPSRIIHRVDDDEEDENEDDAGTVDDSKPNLHVSKIYSKNDISTLVRSILSVLDKMLRCKMIPFASPFDRMVERTILEVVGGVEKWRSLSIGHGL